MASPFPFLIVFCKTLNELPMRRCVHLKAKDITGSHNFYFILFFLVCVRVCKLIYVIITTLNSACKLLTRMLSLHETS